LKSRNKYLYNVMFPVWMLMLFPIAWLVIVPSNFIIDSLVFVISMYVLKIENKKQLYKKNILKIFAFGFLADIIGSLLLLSMTFLNISVTGDEWYLTIPALFISSVLIFVFNYFVTFKKLDTKNRLKLSLIIAIVTAPYTFLIPISWIY